MWEGKRERERGMAHRARSPRRIDGGEGHLPKRKEGGGHATTTNTTARARGPCEEEAPRVEVREVREEGRVGGHGGCPAHVASVEVRAERALGEGMALRGE